MYKYFKRFIDFILSLVLVVILAIPMLLIGIIIRIESPGPAIFKQLRTGKNGKNFYVYKFRSMASDNDVYNLEETNKVTKFGAFIRKTSLDELPQLFNVLKGQMSFIGPRPWIVDYYNNFTDYQKRRVEVTPGITGLAQATGRNNLTIFEKIDYDIEYVNNYSLKMDLKVIFLTIKTVISKEGAEISKSGINEEIEALKENFFQVTRPLMVQKEKEEQKDEQRVVA